mmetsp:Transcript_47929/g.128434  ORF Transcript_47929/g.128434 Transcript_47929/m.128434 type:complete len:142 (+) Transcript_47929:1-426(+)
MSTIWLKTRIKLRSPRPPSAGASAERAMDVATQNAMKADLANKDFGNEDPVYCIGNNAYVPRLVQADIPWHRPPVSQVKMSTKKGGGGLRSLGAEVYAPSGMELRPEDLATTSASRRPREEPLGSLVRGGAASSGAGVGGR